MWNIFQIQDNPNPILSHDLCLVSFLIKIPLKSVVATPLSITILYNYCKKSSASLADPPSHPQSRPKAASKETTCFF